MYRISICLSDLPKEKMKRPANGKVYITIVVADKREKDQYGHDATAWVDQTKEEREAKTPIIYIGNGNKIVFEKPVTAEEIEQAPAVNPVEDDHPF